MTEIIMHVPGDFVCLIIIIYVDMSGTMSLTQYMNICSDNDIHVNTQAICLMGIVESLSKMYGLMLQTPSTVGVKLKFPFTGCLSTVYCLNGNSFSCVFSVHTTDKLNMCSVISTS